jgi:hypothetical protein
MLGDVSAPPAPVISLDVTNGLLSESLQSLEVFQEP